MKRNFVQSDPKMVITVLTLIVVSMCGVVGSTACQEKDRLPSKYLIRDRYIGWVRINYGVKDAPSLPIEGGFYVLRIPETGLLNTSSQGEEGLAQDEYYYLSDGVPRKLSHDVNNDMIWGHVGLGTHTVAGHDPTVFEEFFVETQEQYEHIGVKCKNDELRPIIGPIEKCPPLPAPKSVLQSQ